MIRRAALHFFLAVVVCVHMIPIVAILFNSFRTRTDIDLQLLGFPTMFDFSNYIAVWHRGGYTQGIVNSLIAGTGAVLVVLVVNSLASFAVTRLKVYASAFFTGYFVGALSIPAFGILVPLYFMFFRLGLVNSLLGMVLIYSATSIPFTFLFMRAFFVGIPRELEQAAKIDGCSELGALWRITLPLAKPILATAALIVFVRSWNEFLFANTFLLQERVRTVALRFFVFVTEFEANYAYVFTAAVITTLPVVALFLLLQRSFIEGMTQGGLKG